jgi:alkylated DNA nucleotide flippase Atl1
LKGSANVVDDLHEYLSAPRRLWPDDARLSEAIQTHAFYLSSRGPQRTYILRRLEEAHQSKETIDWKAPAPYTIEHVMPQSLSEEWKASLAEEADRFGITVRELHKLVVHTLGNLTLTAYNSELSNSPFKTKRDLLRKSKLTMNHKIAENHTWDGLKISQRGHTLMSMAAMLWPAPLTSNGFGAGRDWSQLRQVLLLIPAGRWTTFGDLAEVIGSHHVPVGSHLGLRPIENSWRVLLSDGKPSPQLAAATAGGQRERLEKEGVTFGPKGNASPGQRMSAEEIIRLTGRGMTARSELPTSFGVL